MFWWIVRIALWALSGFIASRLMKSGALSLGWNILLGLIGGALGSVVGSLVGLNATNTLGSILISVAGACLAIYLARLIWPHLHL